MFITFQISKSQKVAQFHLHGWLDNSPPTDNGLMSMIADIQKHHKTSDNPMVVHCRYTN